MRTATVHSSTRPRRSPAFSKTPGRPGRIIRTNGVTAQAIRSKSGLMGTMNRFRSTAMLVSAALLTGPSLALGAESFPTKPIRVLVPQPPGGSTDAVARLFAKRMVEVLGQQIVIDNR